jgi:HAD superfamily hydrolase (TIGR01549 family)
LSHSNNWAIFDFAGTLAELVPSRQKIVADYVERVSGIKLKTDVITRSYIALDLIMHYSSVSNRSIRQRNKFYLKYNRCLLDMLGLTHLVNPKGLLSAFNEHERHWELKRGALDVLNSLHIKGYYIAIISNFDSCLDQIVYDRLKLSGIIEHLHVSQTEGVEKPSPEFYERFFQKYNIEKYKSFYVGDSYVLDFLPATSIGLKAWLFDEFNFYSDSPGRIKKLNELLKFK